MVVLALLTTRQGSIQILLRYLNCGPREDFIQWETEDPFKKDSKKQIEAFGVPPRMRAQRNLFRLAYMWDTMLYPFSAVTAIVYMLVALVIPC